MLSNSIQPHPSVCLWSLMADRKWMHAHWCQCVKAELNCVIVLAVGGALNQVLIMIIMIMCE